MAANHTWVYDPRKITVIIGGEEVYGWAEGSMVSVDLADDITSTTRGIDGRDKTVNINPMTDGTCTITLQATSPFNKTLYLWAQAYKLGASATIAPIAPFSLRDPSGIAIETTCWLQQAPSNAMGQEVGELQWTLHLDDALPKTNESWAAATSVGSILGINIPSL